MGQVVIEAVDMEKEDEDQILVGMANFTVKTCDDIFRAVLAAVPGVKVAVAMNEAAPRLTRVTGNDPRLEKLSSQNALAIGASHAFVVMMRGAYPINVMDKLKSVAGVCTILGATANPCQVIVAKTGLGNAVLGFVDGQAVSSVEDESQREERRKLVADIGYPLG